MTVIFNNYRPSFFANILHCYEDACCVSIVSIFDQLSQCNRRFGNQLLAELEQEAAIYSEVKIFELSLAILVHQWALFE